MLSVIWRPWCTEPIEGQPTRLHGVPFHWRCLRLRGKFGDLSAMLTQAAVSQVPAGTVAFMVGRDGIEPPTPGFSVLCSTN